MKVWFEELGMNLLFMHSQFDIYSFYLVSLIFMPPFSSLGNPYVTSYVLGWRIHTKHTLAGWLYYHTTIYLCEMWWRWEEGKGEAILKPMELNPALNHA